jgi:hypothetical protein
MRFYRIIVSIGCHHVWLKVWLKGRQKIARFETREQAEKMAKELAIAAIDTPLNWPIVRYAVTEMRDYKRPRGDTHQQCAGYRPLRPGSEYVTPISSVTPISASDGKQTRQTPANPVLQLQLLQVRRF